MLRAVRGGRRAPPPNPDEHRLLLSEAFNLTAALGEEIWPEFSGTDAPVLLVLEEVAYPLGVERQPDGFAPQPGQEFMSRPI